MITEMEFLAQALAVPAPMSAQPTIIITIPEVAAPERDTRPLRRIQDQLWQDCATDFYQDLRDGFRGLVSSEWMIGVCALALLGLIGYAMVLVVAVNSQAFAVVAAFVCVAGAYLFKRL